MVPNSTGLIGGQSVGRCQVRTVLTNLEENSIQDQVAINLDVRDDGGMPLPRIRKRIVRVKTQSHRTASWRCHLIVSLLVRVFALHLAGRIPVATYGHSNPSGPVSRRIPSPFR